MNQNIYQECADALSQVQAESAADAGDPTAGTAQYLQGAPVPAFVGVFTQSQILREDGGGFVPSTRAMIQITKTYLPANTKFRSGHKIVVTPPLSVARACQIVEWQDMFSFWQLTVEDISQNA